MGFLQGKKNEVEGYDVVVAMVMTLAKRDYDPGLFDCFGVVACDEAHHMAAPVMNKAMRLFRAQYVLGLTATKERPDGLTPVLHWSLGPEGFHVERDCEAVKVSIALFHGPERDKVSKDGQPLVALTLNAIARNMQRNFIAERVAAMRRHGRCVMVLSDRNAQLEVLHKLLRDKESIPADDIGLFVGKTKDRDVQLARPLVLSNFSMANENLDKEGSTPSSLATPKSRVTQAVGRIQRPCPTKQMPIVLDVADVHALAYLRWKRQNYYRSQGYQMQILDAVGTDEGQWFV